MLFGEGYCYGLQIRNVKMFFLKPRFDRRPTDRVKVFRLAMLFMTGESSNSFKLQEDKKRRLNQHKPATDKQQKKQRSPKRSTIALKQTSRWSDTLSNAKTPPKYCDPFYPAWSQRKSYEVFSQSKGESLYMGDVAPRETLRKYLRSYLFVAFTNRKPSTGALNGSAVPPAHHELGFNHI